MCVCVRACVRACEQASVRACVRACVRVCVCVWCSKDLRDRDLMILSLSIKVFEFKFSSSLPKLSLEHWTALKIQIKQGVVGRDRSNWEVLWQWHQWSPKVKDRAEVTLHHLTMFMQRKAIATFVHVKQRCLGVLFVCGFFLSQTWNEQTSKFYGGRFSVANRWVFVSTLSSMLWRRYSWVPVAGSRSSLRWQHFIRRTLFRFLWL